MLRDRAVSGSLLIGVVAAVVALGYGFGTPLVRSPLPPSSGGPLGFGDALVDLAVLVVPFALGTGVALLAFRHRVVAPLALVGVFAVVPGVLGWHADQLLVGVLAVGPLVGAAAAVETLVRARTRRLLNPPSQAAYEAISIGVMAALVYTGVFSIRAAVPLWRDGAVVSATLAPAVDLALVLWYTIGVALVLVGLPVALNRRYGLLAPLVGLVAYLLVDLAFVQPAIASGTELVVVLFVGIWPLLATALAGVGAVEWWIRARRGEYDDEDGDDSGGEGGERRQLTVEGGLFGDRI